jgi:hypothetical protein
VAALFQLGWAFSHDRSRPEVVLSAVGELALVAGCLWLLLNDAGRLNRRAGIPYWLAFAVTWLSTTAICVPIFTGADRSAEELSTSSLFFTVVVLLPLLIGLISAIPLSRGWRFTPGLVTCARCETQASIRASYCMACGAPLRRPRRER